MFKENPKVCGDRLVTVNQKQSRAKKKNLTVSCFLPKKTKKLLHMYCVSICGCHLPRFSNHGKIYACLLTLTDMKVTMERKQAAISSIFEPKWIQWQAVAVVIVVRWGQLRNWATFHVEKSFNVYHSFPMFSCNSSRIPIEKHGSHITKSFWQNYSVELLACRTPAWKLTSVSWLHQSLQVRPLLCYPLLFTRTIKPIAGLCAFVLKEENLNAQIPHLNQK